MREQEEKITDGPSLFEELFPEEAQVTEQMKKKKKKKGEHLQLDNSLPPLEDANQPSPAFPRKQNESWRLALGSTSFAQKLQGGFGLQASLSRDSASVPLRKVDPQDTLRRREVGVLVLSNGGKSLTESDFLRVSPRGEHIEGWTSSIVKGTRCPTWSEGS
jgi:hypothetical protein